MRLIDVQSADASAEHEDARSAPWTSTKPSAFARAHKHHTAAAVPSFTLHAIAKFLNTVLQLVRIHAKVLRLSHGSVDGNRFRGPIRAVHVRLWRFGSDKDFFRHGSKG